MRKADNSADVPAVLRVRKPVCDKTALQDRSRGVPVGFRGCTFEFVSVALDSKAPASTKPVQGVPPNIPMEPLPRPEMDASPTGPLPTKDM